MQNQLSIQLPDKPKSGFWLYQSLGWVLCALLQLLLVGSDEALSLSNLLPAWLFLGLAFVGSLLLRLYYQRLRLQHLTSGASLLRMVLAVILTAVLIDILNYLLLYPLSLLNVQLAPVFDAQPVGAKIPVLIVLYTFWSSFYFSLSRQLDLRQASAGAAQVKQELQQIQLSTLLNQLQPHFMFNCINNIRALILEDPASARQMLAHFADMLRYQIHADMSAQVSLRRELQVLADYLALASIQYEQRLRYNQQIADACLPFMLPKLAIQLLLENALKHGIDQKPGGGEIQLQVQLVAEHRWQIELRNTGQLKHGLSDQLNGTGSGLKNLQQRLMLLYSNRASFRLYQDRDWVVAELVLPIVSIPGQESST